MPSVLLKVVSPAEKEALRRWLVRPLPVLPFLLVVTRLLLAPMRPVEYKARQEKKIQVD